MALLEVNGLRVSFKTDDVRNVGGKRDGPPSVLESEPLVVAGVRGE